MTVIQDALGSPIRTPQATTSQLPQVGDLWEIAWNGTALSIILVAALRDTYVMAWPITVATGTETFPSFTLPPLEGNTRDLVAWPDAEYGLNRALLRRCVSPQALTAKEARLIIGALDGSTDLPRKFCDAPDSEDAQNALLKVCAQAWTLADIEWPAGETNGVILPPTWEAAHLSARDIARALGATPAHASDLYLGETAPTDKELASLRRVTDGALTTEVPHGDEITALMHPKFKKRIEQLAQQRATTEAEARNSILPLARAAARQGAGGDQMDAALQRVNAALTTALSE